jgi:hypothetical protein
MRLSRGKILLSFILITLSFHCERYIINICECHESVILSGVYEYPARPGTPLWASLSSSLERINACQIPNDILNSMSTEALVETCLNYPMLRELLFSISGLQASMDFFMLTFNGFNELSQRSGSGEILLKKYLLMNPCCYVYADNKGRFINSFSEFEMILSQEVYLTMLDKEELKQLLLKSIDCLYQKRNSSNDYSIAFGLNTSILITARTLKVLNFSPFLQELEQNLELQFFTEFCVLPSEGTKTQILFKLIEDYSRSYLSQN